MAASAPTLEELVREELRVPVAALVRKLIPELVAEELNGHALAAVGTPEEVAAAERESAEEPPPAAEASPRSSPASAAQRRCSTCKLEKPSAEFTAGHYVCKPCRRTIERDRARRRAVAKGDNGKPEG